jgi:glycosyltransferase involved in cell wall biosynthesis
MGLSQIGWEWYSRLTKTYSVTLVTHIRNRLALLEAGVPPGASDVLYIDTEWFAVWIYRLSKWIFPRSEQSMFMLASLDYFVFDIAVYWRLRRHLRAGRSWDLIHRVTPVTLTALTWLGRLGPPLILGPLNSGLKDPSGFGKILCREFTWLTRLRLVLRLVDGLMGSSRRTTRFLIASRATQEGVPLRYHDRCRRMHEIGVNPSLFAPTPWPAVATATAPLQVLFVGRLTPVKALEMLIDAIAQLSAWGFLVRLTVVGDGPMHGDWKEHAARLRLGEMIRFTGNLPLAEVAMAMKQCHVFCLPSVRESGGAVLIEAMASARPVIAMNFGGPAELVDAEVGALVNLTNPAEVSAEIARLLRQIIECPATWEQRGLNGRQRAEKLYSWDAKLAVADTLYSEVLTVSGMPKAKSRSG